MGIIFENPLFTQDEYGILRSNYTIPRLPSALTLFYAVGYDGFDRYRDRIFVLVV